MKLNFLIVLIVGFSLTQEVYEGYTVYTPGGMSSDNTTYLRDTDNTIINTWNHNNGPVSMPYFYPGVEPGFENTLLYYPARVNNPTMNTGGVGGKVFGLAQNAVQRRRIVRP